MAGNSKFRGSLQTWRERVGQWVGRAGPEDLLNVDIFFDLRPVLGDAAMADRLWNDAWDGARDPSLPPINLVGADVRFERDVFVSNSFAFGGSNAAVAIGRA